MPDFPTFSDLFRVARDEVLTRSSRISRDAVEREGMDANILIAAACAAGDEVVGQLAQLAAGLFLDSAQGAALDRLCFDRYGLVRKPAAASLGSVQFATPTATVASFAIPAGAKLSTADGIQFITISSTIFPNASVGPVTMAVRSVLAGGSQNVKAGTITSIAGFPAQPTGITVVNPFATAGGDDTESDDSLRDRARKFFTTVRRGTLGALEEAALSVEGVRKAVAFEVIDAIGRPARLVQLIVADSFTEQFVTADAIPARYQVQSQMLASQVSGALAEYRPAGVFVQVLVSNVVLQAFQLALTFQAGTNVETAALAARAAMVTYVNSLNPGASIVIDDALTVLSTVPGLATSGNNIISPAGNVAAKPLQVLRTSLGLVSAIAAQTDTPIITGTNPDAYTLAGG